MRRHEMIVGAFGVAVGAAAMLAYVWVTSTGLRAPLQLVQGSGWSERHWPLRVDPWWPSKAFTCPAAACGADLQLYLRIKVGFCNCETGVADDAELERISDFAIIGQGAVAVAQGRKLDVGWMKGRIRPYMLVRPGTIAEARGASTATASIGSDSSATGPASNHTPARSAILIGLNDRCDAVVATVVSASGTAGRAEVAGQRFIASEPVLAWIRMGLGR